jgi:hypothetical protein
VSAVQASPAASGSAGGVPADPVRALQHALYRVAKADLGRRFHALHVGRRVLRTAGQLSGQRVVQLDGAGHVRLAAQHRHRPNSPAATKILSRPTAAHLPRQSRQDNSGCQANNA